MIDGRVGVHQALAVGEIQPVQRALGALAVEHRDDVVPDDPPAEREGVGRDIAAPGGMNVHARHVERVDALFLDLVVIEHGILAGDDLGDGVGEVLLPRRADVGLDDLHLAVVAAHDERPRVRHRGHRAIRRRHEQNLQRLLEDEAVRHGHVGAVVRERGVERGKRARVRVGELAEVAPDDVGLFGHRRGERAELQACRQARRPRQLGREPAVDDDQPERARPRRGTPSSASGASFDGGASLNSVEAIGETLVKRHSSSRTVGKPELDEARGRVIAEILQPA